MAERYKQRRPFAALRIVGIYALVGALWIFFSDSALRLLVSDPDVMSRIAIAKGWFYVAVTAALLFLLIDRAIKSVTEAEKNRQHSEARYRALFQHSGDALVIHSSPDWDLSDANDSAVTLFGYPSLPDFLKSVPADLSPQTQPDGEDSRAKAEKILRATFSSGTHIFPWRCRKADGTEFDATIRLTRIEFGGKPSILAAIRDVTELNRIEAEKQEIERRLMHAQKLESLGVLAGGIAHDFNNLLAAANGNIEFALLRKENPEEVRENLSNAKAALRRAAQLTKQMLDYSRKGGAAHHEIDLNALIAENTEIMRAIVPRTIAMTVNLAKELGKVNGDGGQLHQVVMNLITNASEAIPAGNGKISISTKNAAFTEEQLSATLLPSKAEPGEYAVVEVTDNGAGMTEDTLKHLFEPFFTTKTTGRGLGMSVVMSIVTAHKGAVLAKSSPGAGTTMTVLIPLAVGAETAVPPTGGSGADPTPKLENKAVLLADDDDDVRQMCRAMLAYLGYETIEATNGAEAVAKWKENKEKISVILLDQSMPVMDGPSALRELRAEGAKAPIVLISGYDDIPTELSLEASGFVRKPFSMGELGLALSKALAEAK